MNILLLGGLPQDRSRAARRYVTGLRSLVVLSADTLPFTRVEDVALPPSPRAILIDDIERACPDNQQGGTRLVLTQSLYLVQKWIDRLDEGDRLIATADRAALEARAPEALRGRGPWRTFEIVDLGGDWGLGARGSAEASHEVATASPQHPAPSPLAAALATAYAASDPAERLRLCREATVSAPDSAAAWLALASAGRETQDGSAARNAFDRATALAPGWEAVHYESAKLWLACDDMPRARDGFQRAANLMPTFAAAFSNLGATLGELDETERALAAFEHALDADPGSHTILNNLGVVSRELGRLDRAEAAFRRVVELAPDFAFGHYNLGHTLFLAGRYAAALDAYETGQRLDPEKNRRQGCRLAMARLATGDVAGAERDLWRFALLAPPAEREDLLLETYEIALALATTFPPAESGAAHAAHHDFLTRLGSEITKSE